jgi:capsular polysaccharide transport system permease protein
LKEQSVVAARLPGDLGTGTSRYATPARMRPRHRALVYIFLLWVVLPTALSAAYLYLVAADQYASRVGFSIRKEENSSAIELLGGITELSGSSSSDANFLYKYIGGREMMQAVDRKMGLKAVYARDSDPVFGLSPDATVEEMERYWNRMVKVFFDSSDGLIEVQVKAFTPAEAQRIATIILDESSRMVNDLTDVAREDTIRYARDDLDHSVERLKNARQALTAFRNRTQIVDPSLDIAGRMGLLNQLQTELATALIDLDMLQSNTGARDQRIVQTQQRIDVIESRIKSERAKVSNADSAEGVAYSKLLDEFESLRVDLEFAEKAYVSSLAAYDVAQAQAQKQTRYLAPYVAPTLAEEAEYPQQLLLITLIAGFLFLTWGIAALLFYSVRDRR